MQPVERVRLSWDLAADLVLYGVLLIGLSLTAQHLQQAFPRLTFFTGLVGGDCASCGAFWDGAELAAA